MDSTILVICSDQSSAQVTSQRALEEAGWKGKIILVTAKDPLPDLREVEGVLLTGGADIHPKYWDAQEPLHEKAEPDDARTDLEIKVIRYAQEK
ncbi:MAG: gamma-glutamyl-gamma-aminobutyrate hydrolase family protein, partial [Holophagaceae bacterium]